MFVKFYHGFYASIIKEHDAGINCIINVSYGTVSRKLKEEQNSNDTTCAVNHGDASAILHQGMSMERIK